jgi:cytochrome oxidase assembly protein ShyY1
MILRWNGAPSRSPANTTLRIKSRCGINITATQYGYHLITPLLYNGTAVLVNRGWIPADADWRAFDEVGEVTVTGQIRLGQGKPAIGGVADALPEMAGKLEVWNNLDVERMSGQFPIQSLKFYSTKCGLKM